MVKLPAYTADGSLDIGSDTFRTQRPDTQIADAATGLGRTLFAIGIDAQKQSRRADLKASGELERNENYRSTALLLDYERKLSDYEKRLRSGEISSDREGNDYVGAVEAYAKAEEEKLRAGGIFSGKSKEYVDLAFAKARSKTLNTAAEQEFRKRNEFYASVHEDKLGTLAANVVANGASFGDAKKEWEDFVRTMEGTGTARAERILALGLKKLSRLHLEAEAQRNGVAFVGQMQALFGGDPGATSGNAVADAARKYAPAAGIDPKVAVAIGWIESRLKADHGKPIGRDGKPMSSAEGGWQVIDGTAKMLGIVDKTNMDEVTPKLMAHLKQNQDAISALGRQPTPGTTYMTWNVGLGVALSILKSDPNRPIEDIIYASYPTRPGFAAMVLRNNPSMYRAGMTAGEVIANYETKVSSAMAATKSFMVGGSKIVDDTAAAGAATSFLGSPVVGLTARDLLDVYTAVLPKVQEQLSAGVDESIGRAMLSDPTIARDVHDKSYQKTINATTTAALPADFTRRVATGDDNAMMQARSYTRAAGFMPEAVVHGFRSALDSKDTSVVVSALIHMAAIRTEDPQAWGATKGLQEDEKRMVSDFIAYSQDVSPAVAAQRVMKDRTPEGRKTLADRKTAFAAEWRDGRSEKDADETAWSELRTHFDAPWTLSNPDLMTDGMKAALVSAYQSGVFYHRSQLGKTLEEAKLAARADLSAVWGTSSVASNMRSQALMPYPPEKVLGADKRVDGTFDWVRVQAENRLKLWLAQRSGRDGSTLEDALSDTSLKIPNYMLLPDPGAGRQARAGMVPEYTIVYEDKNGRKQSVPGSFRPDFYDAMAASERRLRDERASKPKRRNDPGDASP